MREFNATLGENVFVSQEISLELGFAGKPQGGSGYIIAPYFETLDATDLNWKPWTGLTRLPLEETNGSSSSVKQFNISTSSEQLDWRLRGGFAQSPIRYTFDVNQTNEKIDRVYFMVNGRVEAEATEPPYSFAGIPRVVQDFTIYALVRDTAGNIKASEKILVSTEKFLGSGIAVSLNMADGLEIESNSSI